MATGKPKDRQSWLHEHVRGAPVTLDRDALALLADHVGEDLGRVEGLLSALAAAYGEGATISAEDLAPYLGERGNVPRYQLTDAIDRGEPGQALRVLHRMLDSGALVPIQVLATLHGHFSNMLVLDGDDVARRARRGGHPRLGPLRGQEGARAVTPPGQHPDRRGHQPHRQGRPRRARGQRARLGDGGGDPGGPPGPPDPARTPDPAPRRPRR